MKRIILNTVGGILGGLMVYNKEYLMFAVTIYVIVLMLDSK